ncbi:MAG: RNA-binding protein [Gammaproteobacteria bacterium]|nr:RNA-binding protein [Gammaproteobacteria bacterium]
MPTETPERIRIDKWLWAARFFKTRQLAAEAVSGGHVHVNGERSKPSHGVKVGDELKITRSGTTYQIRVSALASQRGSATAAQSLYVEDVESVARREQQRLMYKLNAMASPRPQKRPDKRDRRRLRAFREQQ